MIIINITIEIEQDYVLNDPYGNAEYREYGVLKMSDIEIFRTELYLYSGDVYNVQEEVLTAFARQLNKPS